MIPSQARRERRVRDALPSRPSRTTGSDGYGTGRREAGPSQEVDQPGQLVLAPSEIALTTSSGVPVPAYSVWMASLMMPPRAGVVAWSR